MAYGMFRTDILGYQVGKLVYVIFKFENNGIKDI